ncbi:cell surface glycoprotein CD200 receptor 1-like isoform X2 [Fukomys damarensis]|nr:cell surface glycoprotein CD200 receptor 1-like isoform X2 [Fukomys damarensis]
MGTRAVLCCPPVLLESVVVITWKIALRSQPLCTRAYKKETNETIHANCTDGRITWASRPDLSPHLQINAVAVSHDGMYTCEIVTSNGNFHNVYHLQVLAQYTHQFWKMRYKHQSCVTFSENLLKEKEKVIFASCLFPV